MAHFTPVKGTYENVWGTGLSCCSEGFLFAVSDPRKVCGTSFSKWMSSGPHTSQWPWVALLAVLAQGCSALQVALGPSPTAGVWCGPRPFLRPRAPNVRLPLALQKGWKGFFPFGLSVCVCVCVCECVRLCVCTSYNAGSFLSPSVWYWRRKVATHPWVD